MNDTLTNATPAMQPAIDAFERLRNRLPEGTSYIYCVHSASLTMWVPEADGHRRLRGIVRLGRMSGRVRGLWARGDKEWVTTFLAVTKAAVALTPAGAEPNTAKGLAALPKAGISDRVALGDFAKVGNGDSDAIRLGTPVASAALALPLHKRMQAAVRTGLKVQRKK